MPLQTHAYNVAHKEIVDQLLGHFGYPKALDSFDKTVLRPVDRLVFAQLLDFRRRRWTECRPFQSWIARALGIRRTYVHQSMVRVRAARLIEWQSGAAKHRPNVYAIVSGQNTFELSNYNNSDSDNELTKLRAALGAGTHNQQELKALWLSSHCRFENLIFLYRDLTLVQRMVLACFFDWIDCDPTHKQKGIYVSIGTVARRLGLSESSAQKAIFILVSRGYLLRRRRSHSDVAYSYSGSIYDYAPNPLATARQAEAHIERLQAWAQACDREINHAALIRELNSLGSSLQTIGWHVPDVTFATPGKLKALKRNRMTPPQSPMALTTPSDDRTGEPDDSCGESDDTILSPSYSTDLSNLCLIDPSEPPELSEGEARSGDFALLRRNAQNELAGKAGTKVPSAGSPTRVIANRADTGEAAYHYGCQLHGTRSATKTNDEQEGHRP